ncbi:hypothetical protein FRB95_002074 [Tulasnella sp. JGI-2019a]|nr:hypothetical protein FRB95_002074 [Tulasnella sp. JGI-2019a]
MDLLRSLGSAAASSILAKSGLNLPFSLGDKVSYFEGKSIWTLYDATKRDDSSPVSVFLFDANVSNRQNLMPIAKNALRKLRTTRHPDVLKFIDAVESESVIYIVTERVQPLGKALAAWQSKAAKDKEEWLIWGLHRVTVALSFINDSCTSTHGSVRVDSVFISPSGEWKLGGFEVLSNPKDEAAVLYTLGGLVTDANQYASPEVKSGGWSALKTLGPACADAYSLGLLLHSVFNPTHPLPPTVHPPHPAPQPSSRGAIPTSIFPSFKRLLNPNARARFTPKGFLEVGMGEKPGDGSGFFANNGLYKICAGLDGFALSSESEKNTLLRTLKESAAAFPTEFASYKILPSLLTSLEHGGASASQVLPLALQLSKHLPAAEYNSIVSTALIKLFASPDRGTRMALLDNLPEYADKLDNKSVTDKIWPNLQTGFGDTVAVIREATVRSIILIAPKLSDRVLNNDLLRHLAKSQMDPEASIRTNTCILLGRIAPSLSLTTKRKVLVPAFTRSLKDTFVHARIAGLMALIATIDCFEPEELATKVVPCMAPSLVDKEKLVRDQAFKAFEVYMKAVEAYAATLPVTVLGPEGSSSSTMGTNGMPSPGAVAVGYTGAAAGAAAGAAGALAGWAMSSISKKLATSDLQTAIGERPNSAPPSSSTNGSTPTIQLNGGLTSSIGASSSNAAVSQTKGMQLGANKVPACSRLADELAAEARRGSSNVPGGWGDDDGAVDLIDVTADAGDWSEFASAPGAPQLEDVPDPEGWGDMLDPLEQTSGTATPKAPAPVMPNLSAFAPITRKAVVASPPPKPKITQRSSSPALPVTRAGGMSSPSSKNAVAQRGPSLPQTTAAEDGDNWDNPWDGAQSSEPANSGSVPTTPVASLAGMSKEDKAAEMARRREERKNRIAQLKEQKKAGGKG